jgi:hypothetical protein
MRVPHLERLEEASAKVIVERLAGGALDHDPEDVRVVAIDVLLASKGRAAMRVTVAATGSSRSAKYQPVIPAFSQRSLAGPPP